MTQFLFQPIQYLVLGLRKHIRREWFIFFHNRKIVTVTYRSKGVRIFLIILIVSFSNYISKSFTLEGMKPVKESNEMIPHSYPIYVSDETSFDSMDAATQLLEYAGDTDWN